MARGASGARRIELNRAAFDEITLAVADGAFELAKSVIEDAQVPDADPIGVGLIQGGGVLAYVGRKRVAVFSKWGAPSVTKPRGVRLTDYGVTVIGGFGFPGRFVEEGTIKMRAEPFLTPMLQSALPRADVFVRAAVKAHASKVVKAHRS
jgi:hypothetical protein